LYDAGHRLTGVRALRRCARYLARPVRSFLIALAALTFAAAPARADVFVPADPPPFVSGGCGGAVGDVAFTGRARGSGWRVRVRGADGAWSPAVRLDECPSLRVGADGTVALMTRRSLLIRPPGGAFRAAVTGAFSQVSVTANGWIGALTVG